MKRTIDPPSISSFAFIFILNRVIINMSFNYTKHDQYEVKIFKIYRFKGQNVCLHLTAVICPSDSPPLLSYKNKTSYLQRSYIIFKFTDRKK